MPQQLVPRQLVPRQLVPRQLVLQLVPRQLAPKHTSRMWRARSHLGPVRLRLRQALLLVMGTFR